MHAIHDFTGKLRQPSVAPTLSAYVRWRRQVARARVEGAPDPEPPEIAPVSINLDLTTACNYACTHCIDWDVLNSGHRQREEELRASLERMAARGLKSVILIGGGEPTLYPRFAEFVRSLKELGLQVAIVSNGSRGDALTEAAKHMRKGDWIRLSLDSGSNELFRAMHNPRSSKVDLDSICAWVPEMKKANPDVRVGFSYIIVWQGASRDDETIFENIQEMVMAAERAKRSGFDYIGFKPVLERKDDGAEVMDPEKAEREMDALLARIRTEVDRAKELADESFSVYESVNLKVLEDGSWQEYTKQPRTCHMQALRQVLTPMGLYNCPAHRGVEKAKVSDRRAYATDDTARDTGGKLANMLDGFDASQECQEVTCLYNGVNWWIEKLVNDPTLDVESEIGEERLDYFL